MKFFYFPLILILCTVCESFRSYQSYKVYTVDVSSLENANFLKSLADRYDDSFDFWHLPKFVGTTATVMVKPERQQLFEKSLSERSITYKVSIEDLERVFASERLAQRARACKGRFCLNRYYQYEEINNYLDSMEAKYPRNVNVSVLGKSYEGRDIKVVKITNGDGKRKNSIFIDAGIHAREWIAPATALYVIEQLVAGSSRNLLKTLDVTILPLVNVDGYEYTHTSERLWRKTRSNLASGCIGTDGNRNFDFHWGEVGASPDSCSETFRGKEPFSEPETRLLRDSVAEIKDTCKFYLTLHSYGNYLLYPWGWTSDLPDTWKDLDKIAQIGAKSIRDATGTKYTVGSSTNVLYAAAGGSDDYSFGVLNIPISITMELPGGGPNGFDLPANKLKKAVKESAIGIFSMMKAVGEMYKDKKL